MTESIQLLLLKKKQLCESCIILMMHFNYFNLNQLLKLPCQPAGRLKKGIKIGKRVFFVSIAEIFTNYA